MANEKRLIDANALKSCLCKCCNILHSEEPCEPSECNVMEFIDSQPPVDAVEVVHGRWVNAAGGRTICNHCGEYPLYDYFGRQKFSYYCPNCGAKMDGGADNGSKQQG